MVGDAFQGLCQPGCGVYIVHFAGLEEGGDGGPCAAAAVRSGEEAVLASDGLGPPSSTYAPFLPPKFDSKSAKRLKALWRVTPFCDYTAQQARACIFGHFIEHTMNEPPVDRTA